MQQAFFSLIPMLAAAVLVMAGGSRMARQDVETRIPIDRERILDFDSRFRGELARLDTLYERHLKQTATQAVAFTDNLRRWELPNVPGLLELHLFANSSRAQSITATGMETKLPELLLRDAKPPLNPNFAVILDRGLVDELPDDPWLETPAPGIRVYLAQPSPGFLAALFVDVEAARNVTDQHLTQWLADLLTPLDESGERSSIISPTGETLAATGPVRHGPAALSLPIRTDIGTWRTDAWDGIAIKTHYDTRTLVFSGVISVLLISAGLFIFNQQHRAIKLASERVSFVNRVSHELSTPLTNIALNLDLARDHLHDAPPAAAQRLDHVGEEIQRLCRLVANVLTFSRRERDTIEIKPRACAPDKVVEDTIESFKPALARRDIEIECQLDANRVVLVDPDALAQITGNLISNVEKYAAGGKWIRIQTHMTDDLFKLEVRDRGPGIPDASRERVFSAFERVHRGTDEGSSGTGLGLTIAQELAHRMGGSLELMATDQGCAFLLSVPTPPPQEPIDPKKS
ncbi:MAG: HAMP domain-containing sensor histidine kinase [Akkermansiaceae bacterium]|nr:HAMP domain-containing sensor histidine kinase [Akkermansiaceae bacterium]